MFGSMGQSAIKNLGNGGEMDGDVTITGDLEVQGGISLSVDEVIQGTSTIDITNTEALLVRKNDDGGDVFVVDTTNKRVGINATPSRTFQVDGTASATTATGYFYTNAIHTGVDTQSVVSIRSDNASSNGNVLHVQGDGTGNLLTLSKDGSDKLTVTHEGNVKITKVESSASEFISALEINRDYGSATATDLLTGMIFTDDNSVQAGIFTNRYNSAGNYNSRLQFYVNSSSSSMTPATALGEPAMIINETKDVTIQSPDTAGIVDSLTLINPRNSGSTGDGTQINFQNTGTVARSAFIKGMSTGTYGQSNVLVFGTSSGTDAPTEKMRIDSSGNLTVNSGSAIQFGDSSYKIIGSTAGNYLRFYTESTQALQIDDSQNATFGGNIEVLKGSPLIRVKDSTNSVRGFMSVSSGVVKMGGSDNNNVEIQSNGTTRLTIASSGSATFAGNVAIGSAIASYTDAISTSQTLSVGENQDSSDKLASVQIIGRGSGSTDTVGALEFINTRSGSGVVSSIVGGRFNGGSASDGSLSFNTKNGSSLTTKMTINDVGNVGIGTASPDTPLTLGESGSPSAMKIFSATNGNPLLIYEDTDNSLLFNFFTSSADDAGLLMYANGGSSKIGLLTNGSSYFTGGSLGVGTASPAELLHVKKSTGDVGLTIESVASGTSPKLRIKSPADRTSAIEFYEGGSLKSSIWHSTDDSLNFNVNSGGDNALSIASNKNATFAGDVVLSGTTKGIDFSGSGKHIISGSGGGSYIEINNLGQIKPNSNNVYSLGTSSARWSNTFTQLLNVAGDATFASHITVPANKKINIGGGNGIGALNVKQADGSNSKRNIVLDSGASAQDWAFGTFAESNRVNFVLSKEYGNNSWGDALKVYNVDGKFEFLGGGGATFAGDVGIGVTPETSHSSVTTLQVGGLSAISATTAQSAGSSTWLGNNVYINSSGSQAHIVTDEASVYRQVGGTHNFQTVASGSADASISFTTNMIIDINSRISLSNNDSGTSNTVFGKLAGDDLASTGNYNSLFGESAGHAITAGDYNVAVGRNTLDELTTGGYNTAIGANALHALDGGETENVAVGYNAGSNADGATNNICIGSNALLSTGAGTNQIVIGKDTTGVANNSVTLGNADVTDVYMAQDSGAKVHAGEASFAGGVTIASGGSTDNLYLANTSYGIKITNSTGVIDFVSNSSTRMSIANGGGVTFAGEVTAHSGINFPDDASSNPSSDVNTLDSYEEGDYDATVTCGNGTITLNGAYEKLQYVKIGRMVNVTGFIIVSAVSSPDGYAKISLPFVIGDGTDTSSSSSGSVQVHNANGILSRDFVNIGVEGESFIRLYVGDASGLQSDASDGFIANTQLYIGFTYHV